MSVGSGEHQQQGILYVVATPIGNLEDLSPRASRLLATVAHIAAEDTRHSGRLLSQLGGHAPMVSLHEHNESHRLDQIDAWLLAGDDVALISDAGTPLISDPGYVTVQALRERGRRIVPVPGPCAMIAALSAAGLPTDQFTFAGFLPSREGPRKQRLEALAQRRDTLVFYESPHRILATLEALEALYTERQVVLARELTKTYETFLSGTPVQLIAQLGQDANQSRGEFVIIVQGAAKQQTATAHDENALLHALLEEGVGVKQAAGVAARVLGGRKQARYMQLQAIKGER